MDDKERLEFIVSEMKILNEKFYKNVYEQIMLCQFFKELFDVAKGIQPAEDLNEIKKSML